MSYLPLNDTELTQYFKRIGFVGSAKADLNTLQRLHSLHPIAIPFENIEPWLAHCPSLTENVVFQKLVIQQRGGYCFEHNQLFMRVLKHLGFQVRGLAARVTVPDAVLPRTHMVLLVTVDKEAYLVDVGFGGLTMTTPLNLALDSVQHGSLENWRINITAAGYLLEAQIQGNWQANYAFSLEAQTASDYLMANWYVATHPGSRFVKELIAARTDTQSRHALLNRRYMQHRPGQKSIETQIASPTELLDLLQQVFRINTNAIPELSQQIAKRLF